MSGSLVEKNRSSGHGTFDSSGSSTSHNESASSAYTSPVPPRSDQPQLQPQSTHSATSAASAKSPAAAQVTLWNRLHQRVRSKLAPAATTPPPASIVSDVLSYQQKLVLDAQKKSWKKRFAPLDFVYERIYSRWIPAVVVGSLVMYCLASIVPFEQSTEEQTSSRQSVGWLILIGLSFSLYSNSIYASRWSVLVWEICITAVWIYRVVMLAEFVHLLQTDWETAELVARASPSDTANLFLLFIVITIAWIMSTYVFVCMLGEKFGWKRLPRVLSYFAEKRIQYRWYLARMFRGQVLEDEQPPFFLSSRYLLTVIGCVLSLVVVTLVSIIVIVLVSRTQPTAEESSADPAEETASEETASEDTGDPPATQVMYFLYMAFGLKILKTTLILTVITCISIFGYLLYVVKTKYQRRMFKLSRGRLFDKRLKQVNYLLAARFPSYQTAYFLAGFIVGFFLLFIAFLVLVITCTLAGSNTVGQLVMYYLLHVLLPQIVVFLLNFFVLSRINSWLTLDKEGNIKHPKRFMVLSIIELVLSAFSALVSFFLRVIGYVARMVVGLVRLDQTPYQKKMAVLVDGGYRSYLAMLRLDHEFSSPVATCAHDIFTELLLDMRHAPESSDVIDSEDAEDEGRSMASLRMPLTGNATTGGAADPDLEAGLNTPPRWSFLVARNRWQVAYTLLKNPEIRNLRKLHLSRKSL